VRTFKLTDRHLKILNLLSVGTKPTKIAKRLNCDIANVYRHIKRLEREGYLKKERVTRNFSNYYLTPKGHTELSSGSSKGHTETSKSHTETIKPKPLRRNIRGHKLAFRIPIREAPRDWYLNHVNKIIKRYNFKIGKDYNVRKLRNWDQYIFYREETAIRTTPSSIIIDLPPIYESNPADIIKRAYELLDDVIPFTESLLRIKLERRMMRRITQEYAIENCEFADFFLAHGLKPVWYDDHTGEKRMWVDTSKGVPELEAGHTKHAEDDIQRVYDFIHALHTGEFDVFQLRDMIAQLDLNNRTHLAMILKLYEGTQIYTKQAQRLQKAIEKLVSLLNTRPNSQQHAKKEHSERSDSDSEYSEIRRRVFGW